MRKPKPTQANVVKAIYQYEKELLADAKDCARSRSKSAPDLQGAYLEDALDVALIAFYAERGYYSKAYELYCDLDTFLREGLTEPVVSFLAAEAVREHEKVHGRQRDR